MDNEKRIYAAEAAIAAHATLKDPGASEQSLADLLADLMHFADRYEIDFDFALLNARVNYDVECSESD